MRGVRRRLAAAVVGALALGCARPAWDAEALRSSAPQLAARGLRPLAEITPYLLVADSHLTFFLCRWQTETPITVSIPAGMHRGERRAIEAALRAWEGAGIGVRFDLVEEKRAAIMIQMVAGPVPTAVGPGSGNTIADCLAEGPAVPAPRGGRLDAELYFASIRLARQTPPDARGRARDLTPEELAGAVLHELGHALGWQGHLTRGSSALRADVESLRRLGSRALGGAPFEDEALGLLYALPSGLVLGREPVERWRTNLVDRMSRLAVEHHLQGPFARAGDAAARIFWLDADGTEFGLQVINLADTLRHPGRVVVVPEARVRRALPRSRDLRPGAERREPSAARPVS